MTAESLLENSLDEFLEDSLVSRDLGNFFLPPISAGQVDPALKLPPPPQIRDVEVDSPQIGLRSWMWRDADLGKPD